MSTDSKEVKDNSTEYQNILELWQAQAKSLPFAPPGLDQQDLLDLFCCFLDQVWSDAKQMSQGKPKDEEAATNGALGLQWMRQTLDTKQKLIDLISPKKNTLNDSAATIRSDQLYTVFPDTSISSFASEVCQPIKLRRFPSTPTLIHSSSSKDEQAVCMHSTQTEFNCMVPISRKSLFCHYCHKKAGMKRSFSANDVASLVHTSNSSYHSVSSGEKDENDQTSIYDNNCIIRSHSVGSKHISYSLSVKEIPIDHNPSCHCFYPCQSEICENNDETDIEDTSLSGSKLLLEKEENKSTELEQCYQEKLAKYMLIEDGRDYQDDITLQSSLNSSNSNSGVSIDDLAYQHRKEREELWRYIFCEHADLEMEGGSNQGQNRYKANKKESKFIQILKSSTIQLSLFNTKKKNSESKQRSFSLKSIIAKV